MYNIDTFGQRIIELRKKRNLTQEDLAEKLGITSQAVSKWENNIGFPDITLLPRLAEILDTSIEYLFGKMKKENLRFAKSHEGLCLVADLRDTACYSDKTVEKIENHIVRFADGSSADLSECSCVNIGKGEIKFVQAEYVHESEPEYGPTEKEFEFDGVAALEVEIISCNVEIEPSDSGKTYVKASGSSRFIKELTVSKSGSTLSCVQRRRGDGNSNGNERNKLVILSGERAKTLLEVRINGSGAVASAVAFETCSVSINGSGDIHLSEAEKLLRASVNGSGDITCDKCGSLLSTINGSGCFTVKSVKSSDQRNEIKAGINGSGSFEIAEGFADKMNLSICGSGNFLGKGLAVNELELNIPGSGEVVIGRVIEKSIEKVSKKSKVRIINRGT